jgi:transcriptional regulator with XRE-family HTH domain
MMSNGELGARIGVSHSMASRIRNGNRLPSTKVLDRIHQESAIPLDDLIAAHRQGSKAFGKLINEKWLTIPKAA